MIDSKKTMARNICRYLKYEDEMNELKDEIQNEKFLEIYEYDENIIYDIDVIKQSFEEKELW